MRLTLRKPMRIEVHTDIERSIRVNPDVPLVIMSVEGTPCDAVIVAIEGAIDRHRMGIKPSLCVSGINLGPNLSVDVLHSGTVSAAREASMYGIPSISTSLADYKESEFGGAADATMEIIEKIVNIIKTPPLSFMRPEGAKSKPSESEKDLPLSHFLHGNIMLNINVPSKWNGIYRTGPHGARWYAAPTRISNTSEGEFVEVGAATIINEGDEGSDTATIEDGGCSITAMPVWPQLHPLSVPDLILEKANVSDQEGYPAWLSSQ
jgi:broad specificity polyphosphatase/5'/3'-nucleotidase SurE